MRSRHSGRLHGYRGCQNQQKTQAFHRLHIPQKSVIVWGSLISRRNAVLLNNK